MFIKVPALCANTHSHKDTGVYKHKYRQFYLTAQVTPRRDMSNSMRGYDTSSAGIGNSMRGYKELHTWISATLSVDMLNSAHGCA
ncbi:MAG: hypothetical protein V4580_03530 [Bacteroidota bacterium]